MVFFFFSSRRRHTRLTCDWSSDVCSSDLSSHQRAFAVETMGRNCGYIALMAGIAGGAEVIALPESELKPAEVAERLGAAAVDTLAAGKHGVLVGIIKGDIVVTPLAEIAGKMRPADASLLELAKTMAR